MRKLIRLLAGAAVLGAIVSVMLLSASVYTFARLTDETLIAEVRFEPVAQDRHIAYLSTGDFCAETVLPIEGDQWRIDAEFVKWHYWATLFGFDSQYRLDRFEGRFSDVDRQNRASNNAHALGNDTALDVVEMADALGNLNFLMDASYGSSTYQTIAPGLVYEVYKSPTGIFTRSRAAAPPRDADSLPIEIRSDCGGGPGPWQQITGWVDQAVARVL